MSPTPLLFTSENKDDIGILNKGGGTMFEKTSVSLVSNAEIGFTYNVIRRLFINYNLIQ